MITYQYVTDVTICYSVPPKPHGPHSLLQPINIVEPAHDVYQIKVTSDDGKFECLSRNVDYLSIPGDNKPSQTNIKFKY